MTHEEQIENCKFLINRFDHYADAANNKGNLMLAYHFFVVGGIMVNYKQLESLYGCHSAEFFMITTSISIISLISVFFIFRAIHPFLKSGDVQNKKLSKFQQWAKKQIPKAFKKQAAGKQFSSLIYFGSISKRPLDEFLKNLNNRNDPEWVDDLQRQVYQLATGINKKYRYLSIASFLMYIHILIAAIIILKSML